MPWGHHRFLLDKVSAPAARLYYLDKERGEGDRPSIGIILCAEKDDVEVEYALRTKKNPIGVAAYELQAKLPRELKGKLPTAKQLADVVRAELPEGGANT
jgi:hypothetical protein